MKRIKFLYGSIIALGVFILIRYVFTVLNIPSEFIKSKLLNFPIFFFIGLIYLERGLFYSIKNGYFNSKSIVKFKRGGLFLILSGIINLAKNVFLLLTQTNNSEIQWLISQNISQSVIISIVGFGLIIISDFIKKGTILKQENDLTI